MTADNVVVQMNPICMVSPDGVRARDALFYEVFSGLSQELKDAEWGLLAPLVIEPAPAVGADGGGEQLNMLAYHRINGGTPLGLTGDTRWYLQKIKDKNAPVMRLWKALANFKVFKIDGEL